MSVLGGLELIEDIAAELAASPATVSRWCRQGTFPSIKHPGKKRVFIPRQWVDAYLAGDVELVRKVLPGGGWMVKPKGCK